MTSYKFTIIITSQLPIRYTPAKRERLKISQHQGGTD